MKNQQFDVGRAFAKLQKQFSGFLQNLPLFNPNASSFQATLESAISDRGRGSGGGPLWTRIGQSDALVRNSGDDGGVEMSKEAIAERLAGVALYALANAAEEFVLVSGLRSRTSIGLFCFKEEDAEALLDQMKAMSPGMRNGSKVVPVSLNQVFQLKLDGLAFRLIPESGQVKHALREKQRAGESTKEICEVPVFQEDPEKSISRASQQQNQVNLRFISSIRMTQIIRRYWAKKMCISRKIAKVTQPSQGAA